MAWEFRDQKDKKDKHNLSHAFTPWAAAKLGIPKNAILAPLPGCCTAVHIAKRSPGVTWKKGKPSSESIWEGIASDRRWAMGILGCAPEVALDRDDVNQRFRKLLRDAHPDSGGSGAVAAERIAEIREARELLLSELDHDEVASANLAVGD